MPWQEYTIEMDTRSKETTVFLNISINFNLMCGEHTSAISSEIVRSRRHVDMLGCEVVMTRLDSRKILCSLAGRFIKTSYRVQIRGFFIISELTPNTHQSRSHRYCSSRTTLFGLLDSRNYFRYRQMYVEMERPRRLGEVKEVETTAF